MTRLVCLWLLDEHKRIVLLVIVIVEVHDAAHEGVVRIHGLIAVAFIVDLKRHHHRFLNEVRGVHDRVRMQFPKVLYFVDALDFVLGLRGGLEVGVARAVLDAVPELLAADAAHVLLAADGVVGAALIFVLLLVFALVLAEFAAGLFLAPLSAAPPHFAAPLGLVRAARPVVVFLLDVLVLAVLARLDARVEVALARDELLNARFLFVALFLESADFLLLNLAALHVNSDFFDGLLELALHALDLLPRLDHNDRLFDLNLVLARVEFLGLVAEGVALGLQRANHRLLFAALVRQLFFALLNYVELRFQVFELLLVYLLDCFVQQFELLLQVVQLVIQQELTHLLVEVLVFCFF